MFFCLWAETWNFKIQVTSFSWSAELQNEQNLLEFAVQKEENTSLK